MKTNKGNLRTKKELPEVLERYRLVSYKELEALLGRSRKSIWLDVKEKRFPAPKQIGRGHVAWPLSTVIDYIESLPKVTYSQNVEIAIDKTSTDISEVGLDDL
tara:strand:+ start:95 stop:403 length:309 start_codon:yes stop_codon:yes gene_type:complete